MATLVVPAAGEGSRLGGTCPKALVDLGGRPLIEWVVSAADGYAEHVVVVIQRGQQRYFEEWAARASLPLELTWAFQDVPEGSLAAVRIGVDRVRRLGLLESGVVIIWSDQVGAGASTIRLVSESIVTDEKLLAVPLCETSSPYVWVELDRSGRIAGVKRTRDGDVAPASGLADLGIFGLSGSLASSFLAMAEEGGLVHGERELDFTYALPALSAISDMTLLPRVTVAGELVSVNTPEDLARARDLLGRRDD